MSQITRSKFGSGIKGKTKPEPGLTTDPRAAATRGLAGQPQAHGASLSPVRPEFEAESTSASKGGGEARSIDCADARGRAVEHGFHARPAA